MSLIRIRALESNVTRDEAVAMLSGGALGGLVRRLAHGPMRSIAPVYVPFRVYRVRIARGNRVEVAFTAVDAVTGALDPYRFDAPLDARRLVTLETRNHVDARLDESATRERAVDKVRRVLFQTGFFKLRQLRIDAEPAEPQAVHIPYWVGFFGSDDRARVAVIDGVRRQREGSRVCQLIESWLTS